MPKRKEGNILKHEVLPPGINNCKGSDVVGNSEVMKECPQFSPKDPSLAIS